MTSVTNFFSHEDIEYIQSLPEVAAAKAKLDAVPVGKIYFSITLTDSLRTSLTERFGIDLTRISSIPMRWIKGDTAPHVDAGATTFENTYLVYLNDSPGEFQIDGSTYPIVGNTGFVFQEGLSHATANTGVLPRLLLGPMNEFAQPVGTTIYYYPSEGDALANTNLIYGAGNWTIPPPNVVGGYSHWRIASNSTGSSPQNVVYTTGNTLNSDGTYYLYATAPCFLAGTTVLCLVDGAEKYVPIENLQKGARVKTSLSGYKELVAIGRGMIHNPGNSARIEERLYKCATEKYPSLKADLYITGCHSILEPFLTESQKEETVKRLGQLYGTENKYRLMACVDERAEPWNSEGTYRIYHFALEHEDENMNYGVYVNGGLLVETCAIRVLTRRSNLELL